MGRTGTITAVSGIIIITILIITIIHQWDTSRLLAIIRKVLAWVLVGLMFRRVENMLGLVLTVDIGFNKEAQFITTLGLEVIEDIIDKVLKFFKIFAHNSFL